MNLVNYACRVLNKRKRFEKYRNKAGRLENEALGNQDFYKRIEFLEQAGNKRRKARQFALALRDYNQVLSAPFNKIDAPFSEIIATSERFLKYKKRVKRKIKKIKRRKRFFR